MSTKTRKPLSQNPLLSAVIWAFVIFLFVKEIFFPARARRPKAYD